MNPTCFEFRTHPVLDWGPFSPLLPLSVSFLSCGGASLFSGSSALGSPSRGSTGRRRIFRSGGGCAPSGEGRARFFPELVRALGRGCSMRGCSVASRPERRIEAPRCTSNTTQPKREQEPFSTAPLGQLTTQPESPLDPSPRSPPLAPPFAPTTRRIADRLYQVRAGRARVPGL